MDTEKHTTAGNDRARTAEELAHYLAFQFHLKEYMELRGHILGIEQFIREKAPLAQMIADNIILFDPNVDWGKIKQRVDNLIHGIEHGNNTGDDGEFGRDTEAGEDD